MAEPIGGTLSLILVCALCLVGLLIVGGLIFFLVKLGVIASYWGKSGPTNVGDHSLQQTREAGKSVAATPDRTDETGTDSTAPTDTDDTSQSH